MENQKSQSIGKGKIIAIVLAIVIVVGAAAFFLTGNLRAYSKAQKLQEDGSYSEALAIYETIPDYKDTALHINECKYQQAVALETAGKYAEAQTAFEAIAEYSDSATHINECKYQQAVALETAGKYAEAQIAFEAIAEYSDSATHINECKYQQALIEKESGDIKHAQSVFSELGTYKDSSDLATAIQAILDQYTGEVTHITNEEAAMNAAILEANTLLGKNEKPLDESLIITLQTAVSAANAHKEDISSYAPVSASEYATAIEALSAISYADDTNTVSTTTTNLQNSITQYSYVNNPSESFVIDRLMRVPDIAFIAAVTEGNDPNGNLGKQGGYTAQIYFSSPLVNPTYATNSKLDVIDAGTSCGGSIEVYETVADAEKRNTYLGSFDGTMFSSGRHTVIGTIIVRTSSELTGSEQKKLETEIIEAITSLNPGPVIERNVPSSAENTATATETSAQSSEIVTVKESGFAVSHGYLYYSVILHNNLTDKAIQFPEIRITSRDAKGGLIGVDSMVLNIIYPGQDTVCAMMASAVNEIPASVEIEYVEPTDTWHIVSPTKLDHPQYIPMEIKSAKLKKGSYSDSVIGELYNPNDYDISMANITVLFRDKDGKLLTGDTGFVDNIKAGATIPFEVDLFTGLTTDNFEVYAEPW